MAANLKGAAAFGRPFKLAVSVLALMVENSCAWGSSNSQQSDDSIFGNSYARDWLYNSKSISMKVEGCAWGYVEDSEEVGCLENGSDDGTTNWYMMANCRRPQVVFSVYASSGSSTSCNNNNFKGSFVTRSGLSEFIEYLKDYDGNFNYNGEDGDNDLPMCMQSNNGYIGLDCSSTGTFVLNYFNDQYCVSRTGNTYNKLQNINKLMSNYEQCMGAWSYGDDTDKSLIHQLIYYSEPCSSLDYSLCKDSTVFQSRSASSGRATKSHKSGWQSRAYMGGHKSWVTKLKYVVGGLFLLASFIMFTGILFTNRRRRRAMMMRKYRQAKRAKREKSKDASKKSRSSSRKRSKSQGREKGDGVFT